MTRLQMFFYNFGRFISYSVLTVMSIIIIRYDFGINEWLGFLIDFVALAIGTIGMNIFFKWVKE